jgi:drug/metabolite transporter (DMT)-like permease
VLLQILIINIFGWVQKTQYLSEGLLMGIFFLICIPLLLVGVFGAFSRPNIVAWKWGFISGIILLAIGIIISPFLYLHNYNMNHSVGWSMFIVLIVCFPFVLAGVFFIWNHYKRIKHPEI